MAEKSIKIQDPGTRSRIIGMGYRPMVKEIRKAEAKMCTDEVIAPVAPPDSPQVRRLGRTRNAKLEYRFRVRDKDGKVRTYSYEYLLDVVVCEIVDADEQEPEESRIVPLTVETLEGSNG